MDGMISMRTITRLLTPALVFGLAVFVAAPAAMSDQRSIVRISGSSWIHDAPTHVARLQGYFDGPGPVIEVEYQASGRASMDRLLAREVDYALVAATPLAQALLEQEPEAGPDDLVVLATVSLSNQTHHVLAVAERGIFRPADLAGRRVGVLADTSAEFFWSLFAPLHGLSGDAVELVYIPIEQMPEALLAGDLDAVVIWDPWVFRFEQNLELETRRFSQRQIYTLNWLLVSHRDTVENQPAVADRVVGGYLQAVKTILQNPSLARELQTTDTDLPASYLREMEDKIIFHLGLQWSVLIDIEQQLDWFVTKRDMLPVSRPGPERYLAPGPISRVAPERLMLLNIWASAEEANQQ